MYFRKGNTCYVAKGKDVQVSRFFRSFGADIPKEKFYFPPVFRIIVSICFLHFIPLTICFTMNLLQAFFIVSGVVISIIAFDIAKRQKFNALHFLVFIGIGIALLVFTFFPNVLDKMGHIFGIQRGADVLVYVSIIFLLYFVLLLLNKTEKNREDITRLVREIGVLEDKIRQHDHR